jgi:hypothetical protein
MVSTGNKQVDGLILDQIKNNCKMVTDHLPGGVCMRHGACDGQSPTEHCCEEVF